MPYSETHDKFNASVVQHYENCLETHGDTHKGVDWPKEEDAKTRYQVMHDVIYFNKDYSKNHSLLDFGCGASHFYEFLKGQGIHNITYAGLDISEKFIALSKKKFPNNNYYHHDVIKNSESLPMFDYIIMNGVFTEKRELTFEEMFEYFTALLCEIFTKAKKGIAFNVMSKAVDWERWDLFHLPTDLLIKFITKKLTRNFVIRNDYKLFEYTTYIYK